MSYMDRLGNKIDGWADIWDVCMVIVSYTYTDVVIQIFLSHIQCEGE